jgi:cobalt-zinc-cadmium efflux system membrane fusion protein
MLNAARPARFARTLSFCLWLAGALAIIVGSLSLWDLGGRSGNAVSSPQRAASDADDTFRPSESQWASLKLVPVRQVAFRDERATDGKIAMNEETTTPVFSPYSGRISRLIAKPGDHVEAGAPLFAIEASEFVQGHNDLVAALATVQSTRSRLDLAQSVERRQRELFAMRGGARKDLEQAQAELVAAKGDHRAAQIALGAARNRLRILGCSEAQIAGLERMEHVGPETIVSAPIGGTILRRKVGLGQYVTVGSTDPVYAVGDLSAVWLVANVRESDAPKMKVGAPVEVSVLAYPGRIFRATLGYVGPALDPSTRRLPVRAEIENPNHELLPEMFASFRIVSGESRLTPAVPQDSLVYDGAQARVWVALPEQKKVTAHEVDVGDTVNGMVEVRRGLSVGETVVSSGVLFIDRAARRN